MITYIGTKMVQAVPMTRQEYNDFRGWQLPADENGTDAGYMVIYPDSNPNTPHYQGYVSWSPKKQFEDAYLSLGEIDHLPTFQQRVIGELTQLKDNLKKLKRFFSTPEFLKLGFLERGKMEEQHRLMSFYKDVLNWRVKRFLPD